MICILCGRRTLVHGLKCAKCKSKPIMYQFQVHHRIGTKPIQVYAQSIEQVATEHPRADIYGPNQQRIIRDRTKKA